VVCLAPRARKDSVRPRRLSGVVVRRLNFTVRRVVQRPQDTLRQLCRIFPLFSPWWDTEEDAPPPEGGLVDGVYYEWTHHAVLTQFLLYFSMNHQSFTPKQLKQFGAWVDDAIAAKDDLENALSTCFLEHARQVKINRVLAPYLSANAKRHV